MPAMFRSFRALPKNERQFLLLVLSQVAVIVAALALFIAGMHSVAADVGTFGTPLVLFSWVLYVVLFDSKSRWPGASASTRFSYLMTFKR